MYYSGLQWTYKAEKTKSNDLRYLLFSFAFKPTRTNKKDIKIKWWKFSLITKTDYLRQTDVLPFTGLDHYLCVQLEKKKPVTQKIKEEN